MKLPNLISLIFSNYNIEVVIRIRSYTHTRFIYNELS